MLGGDNPSEPAFPHNVGGNNDRNASMLGFYGQNATLSTAQAQWLTSRLTAEDYAELQTMSRGCLNEVTLTRGLPCSLGVLAGFFAAKNRGLIKISPIGSFLFYASAPFTVTAVADLFFLRNHPCSKRIQDRMRDLYTKYSTETDHVGVKSRLSYAQLREANRTGKPLSLLDEKKTSSAESVDFSAKQKPPAIGAYKGSYMSGTPLALPDTPSKDVSEAKKLTESFVSAPASSTSANFGLEFLPSTESPSAPIEDMYASSGTDWTTARERKPRGESSGGISF